jgi:hypothetical protein
MHEGASTTPPLLGSNGILMKRELHTLFDAGLVSITPKYMVRVSPAIREKWSNGREALRVRRAGDLGAGRTVAAAESQGVGVACEDLTASIALGCHSQHATLLDSPVLGRSSSRPQLLSIACQAV